MRGDSLRVQFSDNTSEFIVLARFTFVATNYAGVRTDEKKIKFTRSTQFVSFFLLLFLTTSDVSSRSASVRLKADNNGCKNVKSKKKKLQKEQKKIQIRGGHCSTVLLISTSSTILRVLNYSSLLAKTNSHRCVPYRRFKKKTTLLYA